MESQDSWFKYANNTEIDIKENCIEQAKAPLLRQRPTFPHPFKMGVTPVKLRSRDPRRRQVFLVDPVILYGRTETPMADPQNISQGSSEVFLLRDLSMEDVSIPSEGEDNLVLDVDDE